jgi:hypothetical protein
LRRFFQKAASFFFLTRNNRAGVEKASGASKNPPVQARQPGSIMQGTTNKTGETKTYASADGLSCTSGTSGPA